MADFSIDKCKINDSLQNATDYEIAERILQWRSDDDSLFENACDLLNDIEKCLRDRLKNETSK